MAGSESKFHRTELLGASVDLVRRHEVIEFVSEAIASGRRSIVGNHNLHSLYVTRRDPDMAAFFERADLIEIDSMPLVYWARVLGLPTTQANRCTYLDWRDQFWRTASDANWRVFCLGADRGVGEEAVRRLAKQWPGVTFASHHGYFNRAPGCSENQAVVDAINGFLPDVILVGMGMPIQETWVSQNFSALESGVVLTVGAAIDYEAGAQPPAPRFLSGLCLEWLYRLAHDPFRLAGRYLVEPWTLAPFALADLLAVRKGRFKIQAVTVAKEESPQSRLNFDGDRLRDRTEIRLGEDFSRAA